MLSTLLLSLVLFISNSTTPWPECSQSAIHQTPVEIPIEGDDNLGGTPRQQTDVPIRAYYLSGTVIVSFLQDLGNVEITIDEESNGTILQTVVDSSTLSAFLPLNMSSGVFSIYFTTSSGAEYYGQFSV